MHDDGFAQNSTPQKQFVTCEDALFGCVLRTLSWQAARVVARIAWVELR